jgi:hypothetical protein
MGDPVLLTHTTGVVVCDVHFVIPFFSDRVQRVCMAYELLKERSLDSKHLYRFCLLESSGFAERSK